MVNAEHRSRGKVYLVGAGPGDPELLTVKGRRALERCQVVIYDALVNPALLQYVAPEAERIFVGRPHDRERLSQSEIERVMITRALDGKVVVRLKGGDPFIFGRGGEEAWALAEAGIDWEIIPGVSSGHAVPAYAGIPLTHRAYASSVAFVTGHECADKRSPVDWHRLARAVDTIVIFMGARNLSRIVRALQEGGRSPATPIAIIEWGTYAEQRVHVGTLGTILTALGETPIRTPALIVVGDVVSLEQKLAWFQRNGRGTRKAGEADESPPPHSIPPQPPESDDRDPRERSPLSLEHQP